MSRPDTFNMPWIPAFAGMTLYIHPAYLALLTEKL